MALIEVFHTVATNVLMDPDYDAVTYPIVEGMTVRIDTNGYAARGTTGATGVIGIAGDSVSTTGNNGSPAKGNGPYAANLIVGSNGATRWSQNRVSDFYNEAKGSGKLTVYTGVGEFWSDQYGTISGTPGAALYSTAAGLLTTTDAGSCRRIGTLLEGATAYPSGVPGIDTKGSMTLGTFIRFALNS